MAVSHDHPIAQLVTTTTTSVSPGNPFPWDDAPIINTEFYTFDPTNGRVTFVVPGTYRLTASIGNTGTGGPVMWYYELNGSTELPGRGSTRGGGHTIFVEAEGGDTITTPVANSITPAPRDSVLAIERYRL